MFCKRELKRHQLCELSLARFLFSFWPVGSWSTHSPHQGCLCLRTSLIDWSLAVDQLYHYGLGLTPTTLTEPALFFLFRSSCGTVSLVSEVPATAALLSKTKTPPTHTTQTNNRPIKIITLLTKTSGQQRPVVTLLCSSWGLTCQAIGPTETEKSEHQKGVGSRKAFCIIILTAL